MMSVTLVGIFYLNYYVLIPKFLSQRKFRKYAGSIIIILVVVFATFYFVRPERPEFSREIIERRMAERLEQGGRGRPSKVFVFSFGIIILSTISLALSTSIRGTREWLTNEKRLKEIENQKLTAELSYLKAQINPHFFFNTLNGIYALARQKSDQTPEVILKLSSLMRYIIYDANESTVLLDKELEHIENYIDLQKIRLNKKIKVNLEINGNPDGLQIAPLLFSVFLENAFKHGLDYSKKNTIDIKLLIENSSLFFELKNPIPDTAPKELNTNQSGLGLKNIKKRLKLIYPEQHRLSIYKADKHHIVELFLKLNNEVHNN